MDPLAFIADLIKTLAWPGLILTLVLLFKAKLLELFDLLRRVKVGDFALEFEKNMQKLRNDAELHETRSHRKLEKTYPGLIEMASISPNAAVYSAWRDIEEAALRKKGVIIDKTKTKQPYRDMQTKLAELDILDSKGVKIFNDLRNLRNKIAHAPKFDVSYNDAIVFISIALNLRDEIQ